MQYALEKYSLNKEKLQNYFQQTASIEKISKRLPLPLSLIISYYYENSVSVSSTYYQETNPLIKLWRYIKLNSELNEISNNQINNTNYPFFFQCQTETTKKITWEHISEKEKLTINHCRDKIENST